MSVNLVHTGGIQRPVTTALSGTSVTDLLQGDFAPVKSQKAKLASISVVNKSAGAQVVSLFYTDGVTDFEFWCKSVAVNDTAIVDSFPVLIPDGGTLKAKAASGVVVTVVLAQGGLGATG